MLFAGRAVAPGQRGQGMSIRGEIVESRRRRIMEVGHAEGVSLPEARRVPVVPFAREPAVICEIKRRSPSRGRIVPGLDAVETAGRYRSGGIRSMSILTEGEYFGGSLEDLIAVKNRYPDLAVLRKDFLLDEEDLRVSYAAGADAVLLIASLFSAQELEHLYRAAQRLGLEPLVELHGPQDVIKVRKFAPGLVGINSRNLETFEVDKGYPAMIRPLVDWDARCIFESGITRREDALFARSAGFRGVLVGEAAVRNPGLVEELVSAFGPEERWVEDRGFWGRLFARLGEKRGVNGGAPGGKTGVEQGRAPVSPLVKVCGITSVKDAAKAEELGADLVGFVLADSPRRANPDLPREVKNLSCLKVGVVVVQAGESELSPETRRLLEDASLDAVQFHGDESPEDCMEMGFPYYKAVRIGSPGDLETARTYRAPRTLFDASVPGRRGGTGVPIDEELLVGSAGGPGLWLAGGIRSETVEEIIGAFRPELIDVSSSLECAPGIKDHREMHRFFERIQELHAKGAFHHG